MYDLGKEFCKSCNPCNNITKYYNRSNLSYKMHVMLLMNLFINLKVKCCILNTC